MMEFNRILAQAEALSAERPLRTSLTEKEIERIAQYHYASDLAEDDEMRRDGTGSEAVFQGIARQLVDAGVELRPSFMLGPSQNTASANAKSKSMPLIWTHTSRVQSTPLPVATFRPFASKWTNYFMSFA